MDSDAFRALPPNSLFRALRWVGAALLVVAVVLLVVLPQHAGELAPGLHTPILAFEFARSRAEVEALFGPVDSELRSTLVQRFDLGNQIDFAFMILYGGFLALFGVAFARLYEKRYLVAAVLGPFAALSDAAENVELFAISGALGGSYDDVVARLMVFTWLKWGAIAFGLAWLAPALRRGSPLERAVAILCALVGALALGAFFDRAHFAEVFALAVTLAFFGLIVVAVARSRQE